MRVPAPIVGAAVLIVALTACSGGERRDTNADRLRERLDGIEKRLGSMESRLGEIANLAARLDALERRTGALEARPATAPPAPRDPAADSSSEKRDDAAAPSGGAPWPGQGNSRQAVSSATLLLLHLAHAERHVDRGTDLGASGEIAALQGDRDRDTDERRIRRIVHVEPPLARHRARARGDRVTVRFAVAATIADTS